MISSKIYEEDFLNYIFSDTEPAEAALKSISGSDLHIFVNGGGRLVGTWVFKEYRYTLEPSIVASLRLAKLVRQKKLKSMAPATKLIKPLTVTSRWMQLKSEAYS